MVARICRGGRAKPGIVPGAVSVRLEIFQTTPSKNSNWSVLEYRTVSTMDNGRCFQGDCCSLLAPPNRLTYDREISTSADVQNLCESGRWSPKAGSLLLAISGRHQRRLRTVKRQRQRDDQRDTFGCGLGGCGHGCVARGRVNPRRPGPMRLPAMTRWRLCWRTPGPQPSARSRPTPKR